MTAGGHPDALGRRKGTTYHRVAGVMAAAAAQATLHTARLRLVPLAEEHLESEVALDADPDVMRYLDIKPRTREQVKEKHAQRLAEAKRVPGLGFWVGYFNDNFVGWWILQPPDRPDQGPVEGQAELGYRLFPQFWRQGFAKEGAQELMRYGFEKMNLERVFGETMAINVPSRKTMESLGMYHTRTRYDLQFEDVIPGSEHGEVEYAITKDEWCTRQN